jgi:hypothetical protein
MKPIRFNIRNLLIIIFILAIGFAALRESSDFWESGVFAPTIGVLLTSTLLAVHRTESRRAFWTGFALFGWVYLGLSMVPGIEARLITTKALAYLDSKVPGRYLEFSIIEVGGSSSGPSNNQVQNVAILEDGKQAVSSIPGQVKTWHIPARTAFGGWRGTKENFVRIGHSLLALLAAWLGGLLSRRLFWASGRPGFSATAESGGSPPSTSISDPLSSSTAQPGIMP